jgi:type VI secretion system protein ImpA
MGSPSFLDTDSLAAPLAAVDPAAGTLIRGLRGQFENLIREEPEENGHPGKRADWAGVVDLASETLQSRVKDLRVACWLTLALTQAEPKQRGMTRFGGLRDGLRLLRQLGEQSWDSLFPNESPRARLDAISKFLDDPDAGHSFPTKVRLIPVVEGGKEGYGFLHYLHTPNDGLEVDPEEFASAVERLSAEECQTVADDIADGLAELDQLKTVFGKQVPDTVLGLGHLRKALEDCQRWVAELQKVKNPSAPTAEAPPDGTASPAAQSAGGSAAIASREQAYQRLREAAKALGQLEPSSPVPCLVELAVQLAALPFPKLMEALAEMRLLGALVRDNEVQEKLKKNLSG